MSVTWASRSATISFSAITGILRSVEFKQPKRRSTLNIPERNGYSSATPPPAPSSQKKSFNTRAFFLSKPTIVTGIVIVCGVVVVSLVRHFSDSSSNSGPQKPTYSTVLPEEKNINELGGWKRISPPGKEAVFAYADMLDTVPISVSQQPLPKGDVAEIAQKFNATNKIDAGGLTVYIGTSSKGPQSVIFAKNNLLILIKSESKIEDTSWATYAKALK